MDWHEYNQLLSQLRYGKVLPGAIYIHRDCAPADNGEAGAFIVRLATSYNIGEQFNVVKFRSDAPRLSFLAYPSFFEIAHPVLEKVIAIDLASGRSHAIDYRDNANAPILHRKELLLPPGHPRTLEFASLSAAEERAGLFANPATIGFRMNWDRLLSARRLTIDGHSLVELV